MYRRPGRDILDAYMITMRFVYWTCSVRGVWSASPEIRSSDLSRICEELERGHWDRNRNRTRQIEHSLQTFLQCTHRGEILIKTWKISNVDQSLTQINHSTQASRSTGEEITCPEHQLKARKWSSSAGFSQDVWRRPIACSAVFPPMRGFTAP
jgi:hypothetical protein